MTPYWSDDWLTVYQGDCREVMASMEPESVHCVVTSPPYVDEAPNVPDVPSRAGANMGSGSI